MPRVSCIVCGEPAVHRHHVITRAECKKHGIDGNDERNLVPVCLNDHFSHHRALPKMARSYLPAAAEEFAAEHGLGWFLDRYYEGEGHAEAA